MHIYLYIYMYYVSTHMYFISYVTITWYVEYSAQVLSFVDRTFRPVTQLILLKLCDE